MRHKWFLIGAVFCALGLGTAWMASKRFLPPLLKKKLVSGIVNSCATCKADVKSISISFFPTRIRVRDFFIEQGIEGASVVTARIPQIDANLDLVSLTSHLIQFTAIRVRNPQVVVTEGNIKTPDEKKMESPEPPEWTFESDHVAIEDGTFHYYREHQDRHPDRMSSLGIRDISATIDQFGSADGLRDQVTHGHATATLESSGKINLHVAAIIPSETIHVDVMLELRDQNLEQINSYFDVNDGVYLKGELVRGDSQISIRGPALQGWVKATYSGLEVKFRKMSDRGAAEAFFSNLLSSLKINKQNLDKKKADHLRMVELQRNPHETLVSFILRGMKVAALNVASD